MEIKIRKFKDSDAETIATLVQRNFREVNIHDYSIEEMEKLAKEFNSNKIRKTASYANTYVAIDKSDTIVGTGSISSFFGSMTESILLTIFVLPELQRKGIGKAIIQALENDELFTRASRVEIPASKTACAFYEKMGYLYKNGVKQLDGEGHYRMEKVK